MLRAGPFSDERVIALIDLRTVPVYFDLDDGGAAADPRAREFVVAARKELSGRAVPVPPVLCMSAGGEILGEISNTATPDAFLAALLAILRAHPELDRPSPAEQAARTPLERAVFRIALQDAAGAEKLLEHEESEEAHYLLGRMARFRRDWKRMEDHLAKVKSAERLPDVRMERAYRLWSERRFDVLRAHLADFPAAHARFTEARYYEGLAHFHLGDSDRALSIWKQTIESAPEGPWVYRADWAFSSLKETARALVTTGDERVSVLGRVGYLGARNPDLDGPVEAK